MTGNKAARKAILARITHSLGAKGDQEARRKILDKKRSEHKTLIPRQARKTGGELLAQFTAKLEAQGTSVVHVHNGAKALDAVAKYLVNKNLPTRLRLGGDEVLNSLPWHDFPTIEKLSGAAQDGDSVGLSAAFAGAGETGTLFLASGAENPTTLNFVPENHIILVSMTSIRGSYEEAWKLLADGSENHNMPRAVNLVSGPSRTADIEQTIIMGAHGPRTLHVIIIDE